MARVKQTARQSTGQAFRPPWQRDLQRITLIHFKLSADLMWPKWPINYENDPCSPLRDVEGCEKVLLGRDITCHENGTLAIVWRSREALQRFDSSKEYSGLLEILKNGSEHTPEVVHLNNRGCGELLGHTLDAIFTYVVLHTSTCQIFKVRETRDQILLKHAFDGYVSLADAGIKRPPSPSRLNITQEMDLMAEDVHEDEEDYSWSPEPGVKPHYCHAFFRWGNDRAASKREQTSAQSPRAIEAWSNAISKMSPEFAASQMLRLDFRRLESAMEEDKEIGLPNQKGLPPEGFVDGDNRHTYFARYLGGAASDCQYLRGEQEMPNLQDSHAAMKVLGIPELLANILVHLCQKELLLNQRVSRAWNQTISSCAAIQEKLFLRPRPDLAWRTEQGEFNAILYERFPSFFMQRLRMSDDGPWEDSHWYRSKSWCLNPDSPYARAEASWRRMSPCNPPPAEFLFVFRDSGRAGFSNWKPRTLRSDHTSATPDTPNLSFGCLHDVVERIWFQGQYFPLVNHMAVDYGPLTKAAEYSYRQAGSCDHSWRHDGVMDYRRTQFPGIQFKKSGSVLIEFGRHKECGHTGFSPRPETTEFQFETPREPEFVLESPH